ncbi:MAG TPA: prolyl oligopeptidase family serine peptidase [Streptosporangiaceae bacterium]|nr:prolyl oligopeptidase family serine peptidase [Streptosporangiaceae bacterium]
MLSYPPTASGNDADDYHGEVIADPYRWLEDTGADQTRDWIAAQNELTQSWLSRYGSRAELTEMLTGLSDYARHGVPFERGGRWFQFRNPGLRNQPALWVLAAPDDEGRLLLDPNALSADGTVAVSHVEVTHDGSWLAYATSVSGSDWQTWRVRDVGTGADLSDVVDWAKSDGAAWRKDNSGFYYMAPERPPPGSEYLAQDSYRRIMSHRIGTAQDDDELVFSSPDNPDWFLIADVSDDDRYLIISIFSGTAPQAQVRVLDLSEPGAALVPLVGDFESIADVVTTDGTTFYLVTDYLAERKRLVAVDLERPGREHWREVVGQSPDTLIAAYRFGGRFVCKYLRDAYSVLRVHSAEGEFLREIPLPGFATVADSCRLGDGITGRAGSDLMHVGLTSFAESGSLWSHDLATGQTTVVRPSAAAIDAASYTVEQVRVTSADGTELTMFLTRRDDLEPSGDVPVLLYGYGGFDISITPTFSLLHAAWLKLGGLLAVANLRGGGEYGRTWHDGGRLAVKQNVFDDFSACARWLASSGWSRADRTAIIGASNGGLLVGASLTQHPEFFGACVPSVGVLDMLRFHKFTVGRAWIADYGDPDDPEQYQWLRAYSPLHNLRPGQSYPATLVLTGDHDDRVVPGHSFKFAAALQAAQGGAAPVLIRVETSAGHGMGKPTSKIIAESADVLAFLRLALGLADPVGSERGAAFTS